MLRDQRIMYFKRKKINREFFKKFYYKNKFVAYKINRYTPKLYELSSLAEIATITITTIAESTKAISVSEHFYDFVYLKF